MKAAAAREQQPREEEEEGRRRRRKEQPLLHAVGRRGKKGSGKGALVEDGRRREGEE